MLEELRNDHIRLGRKHMVRGLSPLWFLIRLCQCLFCIATLYMLYIGMWIFYYARF